MKEAFWKGRKVLVTGGAGFLGKSLVPMLKEAGAEVTVPSRSEFDLRKESEAKRLFKTTKPEIVIHLAVHGGGIGYMKRNPGVIFRDNVLINTNAVHFAMEYGVKKFVGIGTVCEYPKHTPVPFRESGLWDGYPEETNAPYGLTKRMMLVQTQAYRQEHGFNGIHLLLANMYGPNDNFDPAQSHVIPALIVKMLDAKKRGAGSVTAWGTGDASREFLYVGDAAKAIMLAAERYDSPEPVNVGSGTEITIRDLAGKIAKHSGFRGKIVWDTTKPDGQPKRHLDVSRAKRQFGFTAETGLDDGLGKTIGWYKRQGE